MKKLYLILFCGFLGSLNGMQDLRKNTSLTWQVIHNSQAIGMLIQAGEDPRGLYEDGSTALHYAAQKNDAALCELLLKGVVYHALREIEVLAEEEEVLDAALHLPGVRQALRPLVRMIDSWFIKPQPVTHRLALLVRDIEFQQLMPTLLKVMTKKQLITQLCGATYNEITRFLLRANERGERASDLTTTEDVRLLCSPRMTEQQYKMLLSHWIDAVLVGDYHQEAVRKQYPSHVAALQGKWDAIVDVSRADFQGNTPLHYAALVGHESVIRFLLERGASVTAQNGRGITPLMMAVRSGSSEAVRLVLDRGLSEDELNRHDAEGLTALHYAARYNLPEVVHQLIAAGANPHETTKDMPDVVVVAASAGSRDVQRALEEYDECCMCSELFRKGEEGLVYIGRNCTHVMHRDCRHELVSSEHFNGLCPKCCQPI